MYQNFKQTWRLFKNQNLRKQLIILLVVLVVYSILNHIPIPVANRENFQNILLSNINSSGALGFANLFTGGALGNFSIIMLGLGPYINASIFIQLLTGVIPALDNLSKEGDSGRAKINQITRVLTLPLAFLQSFAMISFVRNLTENSNGSDVLTGASLAVWVAIILAMIAGSMIMMWLGEIITEYSFGNGISILILAGIVSRLPSLFSGSLSVSSATGGIFSILLLIGLALIAISLVILINEAVRNVPIGYTKKTAIGAKLNFLPIKLITVGVIPIIFAVAFLSIPTFLAQIFANSSNVRLVSISNFINQHLSNTSWQYIIIYFILVILFNFFYTSIVFKPKEVAENLNKSGGYIPGIRPGKDTEDYLTKLIFRVTGVGAIALGLIAVLPFVLQKVFNVSSSLSLGGTSMLIVVGVILETAKQVKSKAMSVDYDKFI